MIRHIRSIGFFSDENAEMLFSDQKFSQIKMLLAKVLLLFSFFGKTFECSRQINLQNFRLDRCNVHSELTRKCMQLREKCGQGFAQLGNDAMCGAADTACSEAIKIRQECYMSIPQLNANSRMAADNETMYQLTRDRHILGSNQTRKLVNENELQTHVAKMQQIANLTDVLYETEQKSSSQFYENVEENITKLLHEGDIWLTDLQADAFIRNLQQLAANMTKTQSINSNASSAVRPGSPVKSSIPIPSRNITTSMTAATVALKSTAKQDSTATTDEDAETPRFSSRFINAGIATTATTSKAAMRDLAANSVVVPASSITICSTTTVEAIVTSRIFNTETILSQTTNIVSRSANVGNAILVVSPSQFSGTNSAGITLTNTGRTVINMAATIALSPQTNSNSIISTFARLTVSSSNGNFSRNITSQSADSFFKLPNTNNQIPVKDAPLTQQRNSSAYPTTITSISVSTSNGNRPQGLNVTKLTSVQSESQIKVVEAGIFSAGNENLAAEIISRYTISTTTKATGAGYTGTAVGRVTDYLATTITRISNAGVINFAPQETTANVSRDAKYTNLISVSTSSSVNATIVRAAGSNLPKTSNPDQTFTSNSTTTTDFRSANVRGTSATGIPVIADTSAFAINLLESRMNADNTNGNSSTATALLLLANSQARGISITSSSNSIAGKQSENLANNAISVANLGKEIFNGLSEEETYISSTMLVTNLSLIRVFAALTVDNTILPSTASINNKTSMIAASYSTYNNNPTTPDSAAILSATLNNTNSSRNARTTAIAPSSTFNTRETRINRPALNGTQSSANVTNARVGTFSVYRTIIMQSSAGAAGSESRVITTSIMGNPVITTPLMPIFLSVSRKSTNSVSIWAGNLTAYFGTQLTSMANRTVSAGLAKSSLLSTKLESNTRANIFSINLLNATPSPYARSSVNETSGKTTTSPQAAQMSVNKNPTSSSKISMGSATASSIISATVSRRTSGETASVPRASETDIIGAASNITPLMPNFLGIEISKNTPIKTKINTNFNNAMVGRAMATSIFVPEIISRTNGSTSYVNVTNINENSVNKNLLQSSLSSFNRVSQSTVIISTQIGNFKVSAFTQLQSSRAAATTATIPNDFNQTSVIRRDDRGSSVIKTATISNSQTSTILKRRKRQIIASNSDWNWDPTQPINYLIDAELATFSIAAEKINEAFQFWQNNTCFTFQKGNVDESYGYIFIANGPFAFAEIGRKGAASESEKFTKISVPVSVISYGIIAHLIGHALGLFHVREIADRDEYLIQNANDLDSFQGDFSCPAGLCKAFNDQLDKNSGSTMLQKSFGDTFDPKFQDLKMLNDFYCPLLSCNLNLECLNDGFSHPNLCGECMCPNGFAGFSCAEINFGSPLNCGGKLTAVTAWKTLESPFAISKTMDPSQQCTWLIESPNGTKIDLQFTGKFFGFPVYVDPTSDRSVCNWNHVELRLNPDQSTAGLRFCGETKPLNVFKSISNRAMVLLVSPYDPDDRRGSIGFQLSYRIAEN